MKEDDRMKQIAVLGAGRVGSAIIRDLAGAFSVSAVDSDPVRLQEFEGVDHVSMTRADLSDPACIGRSVENADVVVNALPGRIGFAAIRTLIGCKKNTVDISFFEEDPFELDGPAKKNGVIAVTDCGVAPGMTNMILGFHASLMQVDSFECMVGGLPFERRWPYQYKAPFSPPDVIEEYMRPARMVVSGTVVVKPALSDPELVEFPGIGTLEAFNTDGLRTLLKTMPVPDMREKTLRYPGHAEIMRVLRETGFFDTRAVLAGGVRVRPLDVASALLFPMWRPAAGEREFTVLRIIIRGRLNGVPKHYVYNLFDQFDPASGISSMARTTGYACTAVVRLLAEGRIEEKGVVPPERIGALPGCFKFVMDHLKERAVEYHFSEEN